MATTPYTEQLQGRNIRLLRILPGDPESTIEVELIEASLDNLPQYEALSYVWGDAEITQQIVCNGRPFQITINLTKALRRLRSRSRTTLSEHQPSTLSSFLWVDAICIDQDCLPERNHQVSHMKEIYSKAQRVCIWLGDQDSNEQDEATAVAAIQLLCSDDSILSEEFRSVSAQDFEQMAIQRGLIDSVSSLWACLHTLFTSRWYSRVWCVQEVALACEATFLFSKSEMISEDMRLFSSWFVAQSDHFWRLPSSRPGPSPDTSTNLLQVFLTIGGAGLYREPLQVLNRCSGREAKDPRDNIYGLCGLMEPAIFPIDYTLSTTEVYTHTVLQLIVHMQNLSVLSYLKHNSQFQASSRFPSWVPRWDRFTGLVLYPERSDGSRIFAGRQEAPVAELKRAREGSISLRGLCCGVVRVTTSELSGVYDEDLTRFFAGDRGRSVVAVATTFTAGSISADDFIDSINTPEGEKFISNFKAAAPDIPGVSAALMNDASKRGDQAGDANAYARLAKHVTIGRRVFRTDRNWIGLGPRCMQEGDIVVVFTGGPMPMILRRANDKKDQYYVMGECYIYDIAMGQAYDIMAKESMEERMFELI